MTSPWLFDTHAHVNFAAFAADAPGVLAECASQRVWTTLVGSQLETSRRAVALAEQYSTGVFAAVGLHPVHVADQPQPFAAEEYERLAASPKVVAFGETGIDHFRLPAGREAAELAEQKRIFLEHLRLARRLDKALIMHTREHPTQPKGAYAELLRLLRQEQGDGFPRGVAHCFLGTRAEAEALIGLGFFIGVTGIVTFAQKSDDLAAVVAAVPLERLVIETDAPYLTPEPFRGQRNRPVHVELVAKKIAALKGVTLEMVAARTTANARALFGV